MSGEDKKKGAKPALVEIRESVVLNRLRPVI